MMTGMKNPSPPIPEPTQTPYAPPKARFWGFEYIPAERQLLHSFLSNNLVLGALAILICLISCAVFADWIAPVDPLEQILSARLKPPIWNERGLSPYYLGTDRLGRDVLSNIIFGLRVSLLVGFFRRGDFHGPRVDPRAPRRLLAGDLGELYHAGGRCAALFAPHHGRPLFHGHFWPGA
jgi:hypothetical protein